MVRHEFQSVFSSVDNVIMLMGFSTGLVSTELGSEKSNYRTSKTVIDALGLLQQ